MDLQILNGSNNVSVNDAIFGCDFKEGLVHQAVTAFMSGARQGTKAQKSRSAVRGGGAKPWAQKGTGRARAGTSRSPLWRSGGVTFAAQPRDYSVKLNKKMYRAAIRSILSELVRQERLVVVEDFAIAEPKTKAMVAKMKEFGEGSSLIVTETGDEALYLSARNLINVEVTDVSGLNPVALVGFDRVIFTVGSIRVIEEWLA
ncbi:MAG: 50S ribosomal protein L4 [Gammaproteobacteria bacterium]|nr:50S ribosomal protein L4 [Gammaproteobacteria bacterium]